MVFEEIVLENFATYKGHNCINLAPTSPDKPVILIGGENGCGKTTLLDAFQLVLFGAAAQCSNRGKLPYETYLERCINRDTLPEDGARIKLFFHFYYGGEKKHYRIERAWFRKGKKIQEQFWAYQIVEGEIKYERTLSENWLDYVESFFPSQVAPFFLFDGEKIESLADFEKSGHLIHSAIKSLLGLNLVNQLETDLLSLEKRKHKELASTEESKKLDTLEDEIAKINNRLSVLKTDEAQLNNKLDQHNKQLESVDLLFRQQGGDLYSKRALLEEKLAYRQKELSDYENRLRDIAAGSAPLLMVQPLLESIRYQAVVEEEAHREELIFNSLRERDRALLDILTSGNAASNLISEVTNFLNEDIEKRSKAASVECYLNLGNEGMQSLGILLDSELPALSSNIPQELATLKELRNDVESLERSLASVPDQEKIATIIANKISLQENIRDCESSLRLIKEEMERLGRQLEMKNAEMRRELIRMASIRFEGKDSRRMVHYSAKVRETLGTFREKVLEKHLARIEGLVLNSFKNLLRKESLVEKLKIDRQTCQMRIFNNNDDEIHPERLSAGERQLLATAILWGICQAAGKPLPTIIDTPLGRLDTSHRTNLVQNYFPHASHQVLLLSTNEEIVGKYHDQLKPFISQTCLLSHNERMGGTTVKQGYFC